MRGNSCVTLEDVYRLKDVCLNNETIAEDCFPGKLSVLVAILICCIQSYERFTIVLLVNTSLILKSIVVSGVDKFYVFTLIFSLNYKVLRPALSDLILHNS